MTARNVEDRLQNIGDRLQAVEALASATRDEMNARFDQVPTRDEMNVRFAQVPTREEMNARFDQVPTREEMNARFAQVPTREEMNARFDQVPTREEMNARFDQVPTRQEMLDIVRQEGRETRSHFDIVFRQFQSEVRIIAEGHAAQQAAVETLTAAHDRLAEAHESLRLRVDRLEQQPRRKTKRG